MGEARCSANVQIGLRPVQRCKGLKVGSAPRADLTGRGATASRPFAYRHPYLSALPKPAIRSLEEACLRNPRPSPCNQ